MAAGLPPPLPESFSVAEERSGHCAVVDGNCLYVWGGYVSIEENEVYLPNDELWIYEIDSGLWSMHLMEGELPPSMSGSCGACLRGKLYLFGGCDDKGYSNGEGQVFWGWHNDVHVFDTTLQAWYQPTIKQGVPPQPRAAHACAVLGNKGFVFGGRVLQTRMNDLHSLNLDTWVWSGQICTNGEKPRDRSWHTLTSLADGKLFLYGGLSSDNVPLSDGWMYGVATNEWKQLAYLPQSRPRLWHTACLGKEGEVMVFGGSKDDLHFLDTGHCSDLLIFQTQPYSLFRLSLDCIAKNTVLLESQISWLPSRLLEEAADKITFWAAVNYRQEKKAKEEGQEQIQVS
ncbi:kelch domain-containing protein 1 isoform X2 [Varanus komodoensis]|uniref:kelch domain-containing protein 1 isoform X2 n=1 Tax=Varanus komodoensis TaxID=61221 RepID=UPI001CF7E98D|nr:kelch domain-containing protein 1 isoform X2 [Varanus komodoensis]